MKRVVLVVAMLVLVACGGRWEAEQPEWIQVSRDKVDAVYYGEFQLPNGRVIPCLAWNGIEKGGMSCDWAER